MVFNGREQGDSDPVRELGGQPADELECEPCFADPPDAGERDQAGAVPAHELGERVQLTLAAKERIRRNRDPPRRCCGRQRNAERRVLGEDRTLELSERLARLYPELVDQYLARAL